MRVVEIMQLGAAWAWLAAWLVAVARRPQEAPNTTLLGGAVLSLSGWLMAAASAVSASLALIAVVSLQGGWLAVATSSSPRRRRQGATAALAGLLVFGAGLARRWLGLS